MKKKSLALYQFGQPISIAMRKIKIFIASSSELKLERLEFVDMIQQFNDVLEHRGLQIKPIKWEYLDASMGARRKQDEYNEKLSECELCLVLYWTSLGEYTTEEFNTAYQALQEGNNPQKIYVYFKEANEISEDLREFKDSFPSRYGHFYCTFDNVDTMRLHFLLQLEAYLCSDSNERLITVNKDRIEVDGQDIASFRSVDFVSRNKDYQKLQQAVEKQQRRLAKYPDDKEEMEELARLEAEMKSVSESLLETSRIFINISSQKASSRILAAREHFMAGDIRMAEGLLNMNEIMFDIDSRISDIKEIQERIAIEEELIKASKETICLNIEECRLKIQFLKSSMPDDFRHKIGEIYRSLLPKIGIISDNSLYAKVLNECCDYISEMQAIEEMLETLGCEQERQIYLKEAADCIRLLPESYSRQYSEYPSDRIETPHELSELLSCRIRSAKTGRTEMEEMNRILDECLPLLDKYEVTDNRSFSSYNGLYQSLLSNIAIGLKKVGRTEESISIFKRHKAYCEKYGLALEGAEVSDELGVIYDSLGLEEESEREFSNCIRVLETMEPSYGRNIAMIISLNHYADYFTERESYSAAEVLLENAVSYAEELDLKYYQSIILEELGNLYYYHIDNDEAAATTYMKAIASFEEQKKEMEMRERPYGLNYYNEKLLKLYLNCGHSLQLTGNTLGAIECYEHCNKILYSDKEFSESNKDIALKLFYRSGLICHEQGDFESAANLWKIALEIGQDMQADGTLSEYSQNLLDKIQVRLSQ